MNNFIEGVRGEDWDFVLSSDDVNSVAENYLRRLNELYCSSFPLKIKHLGKKRFDKPWISSAILNHIKLKSRMFKLFKRGLITDRENKNVRNEVNVMVKS